MRASNAAAALQLNQPSLRAPDRPGYVRVMDSSDERVSSTIEAVVTRFRTMVRSVGARRGLLDSDLDEVLQEVRIRLWQAEKSGKELESLGSSYVYTVATTATLDLLRRRRAFAGDRTDDVDDMTDLPIARPSPHDELEGTELGKQIDEVIDDLPIDRRVAVRFHLQGYDRKDIERATGWS